ncbi:MAG TPA: endolytic transglycosylase MltG [Candidatus Coatesbacteria bacterium]|nr:endolytic transglycosylase MltG [Candidatus Coatesbacteria bacterium]
MKKRTLVIGLIGIGALVVVAAGLVIYYCDLAYTPLAPERSVVVEIPPGVGAERVAEILASAGVTEHPRLFRLYLYLTGRDAELKAGRYELDAPSCFSDAAEILVAGRVLTVRFTLPEGLDCEQMALRLAREGVCRAGEFLSAAARLAFDRHGINSPEGYLFPDTYTVPAGAEAGEIARLLLDRAEDVWKEELAESGRGEADRFQTVTLASIVQAEGAKVEEFPRIAGVFANRLARGMNMESCATVLYALGEHKQVLEYRDLKVQSPYNTYLHPGLPPGPINNPGRAALAAALAPEEHGYLYFVSNGDGTHTFSRTLAEHNRARAKTRDARSASLGPSLP